MYICIIYINIYYILYIYAYIYKYVYYSVKTLDLGPKILKGTLSINGEPKDTYFDFDCETCMDWKHGAVFINGFNIGRYHQVKYL